MPDVFLSYSREDQATARRYAEALAREGFDVWWDQTLDAGAAYDEVTERALDEARAVIVLWSRASVASRWVRAEATTADRKGTLVPVMIEDCRRPIMFELTQSADLAGWNGEAGDPRWRGFVTGLRRFVARPQATPARSGASDHRTGEPSGAQRPARPRVWWVVAAAIVLVVAGGMGWTLHVREAPGVPTAIAEPAIAVLPFTNLSSDPEQEYFSDGLSEELLNQLAQVPGLRVIGRTSSFAFKGKNQDLRAIGRALGVDHILEGSVRKSGNSVRINAQLVDPADGSNLWSKTFERRLDDIFAIQEEIAATVAATLQVTLGGREPVLGGTRNFAAYDAFLSARALQLQLGRSATLGAVAALEKAVSLDPQFTAAWAALASLYSRGIRELPDNEADWSRKSQAATRRVLELAPDSPIASIIQAESALTRHDLIETERLASAAMALPPALSVDGNLTYGILLLGLGRPREAIVFFERLRRAEPLAVVPALFLQIAYEADGQFDRAEAEFRRLGEVDEDSGVLRGTAVVRAMGRGDTASVRRLTPLVAASDAPRRGLHEAMLQRLDDPPAALRELRRIVSDPDFHADTYSSAAAGQWAAWFGDPALSLQLLRGMPKEGILALDLMFTIWRPVQRDMRRLPEFRALVRELGLADYWRSTGKWGDFCRPKGPDDFECH